MPEIQFHRGGPSQNLNRNLQAVLIVIHCLDDTAEIVERAVGNAHDLARHLTAQGHEVVAIASRATYGEKGADLAARETVDGIEIHRVGRSLFGKAGTERV